MRVSIVSTLPPPPGTIATFDSLAGGRNVRKWQRNQAAGGPAKRPDSRDFTTSYLPMQENKKNKIGSTGKVSDIDLQLGTPCCRAYVNMGDLRTHCGPESHLHKGLGPDLADGFETRAFSYTPAVG